MGKHHFDAAIDNLVDTIVSEVSFIEQLKAYIRKEKMWKEAQDAE